MLQPPPRDLASGLISASPRPAPHSARHARHFAMPLSQDGDAASLQGAPCPSKVCDAQPNTRIKRYGIQSLTSQKADAYAATAKNPATAANHTDAPELPDPVGPIAGVSDIKRAARTWESFCLGGDGIYAVLQTMAESFQKNTMLAQFIKRLQTEQQVKTKKFELTGKCDEIKGERSSAFLRVGSSLAATLFSFGASAYGANLAWLATQGQGMERVRWNAALGEALKSSAGGLSQFVSSLGDAADRAGWFGLGRYYADQATIAQRQYAIAGQVAQNNAESANNNIELFKEARKNALQAFMSRVQMWGDSLKNLWRV